MKLSSFKKTRAFMLSALTLLAVILAPVLARADKGKTTQAAPATTASTEANPTKTTATKTAGAETIYFSGIKSPFDTTWYVAAGLTGDILNRVTGEYHTTSIVLMRDATESRIMLNHYGHHLRAADILLSVAWVKLSEPNPKDLSVKFTFYGADGGWLFEIQTADYGVLLANSGLGFGNLDKNPAKPGTVKTAAKADNGSGKDGSPVVETPTTNIVATDKKNNTDGDKWSVLTEIEDFANSDGTHTAFIGLQKGQDVRLFTSDDPKVTSAIFKLADYVEVSESAVTGKYTLQAYASERRYFSNTEFSEVTRKASAKPAK